MHSVRFAQLITFTALLVLGGSTLAAKPRPEACPSGTFALDAEVSALLAEATGQPPPAALEVGADGMARLGSCVASLRTKAKRKATLLKATWPTCGSARKLRLIGTQAWPACSMVTGKLRAKKVRRMTFAAPRVEPTTTTVAPADTTTTTVAPDATTSTTLPATTTSTFVLPSTTTFTFPTFSTTTIASTTTSTSTTLPPPDPACGNGVVDAGEDCEGISGCAADAACSDECTCAPLELPSTDQSLIAAALAAGEIDYPTSLVYRMFALFADGRLPEELDGEAWLGKDGTLFMEIAHVWNELDSEVQETLTPFLVRPSEPGSYYDAGPPAPGLAAAAEPESVECGYKPGADRPDWRFTETEHFVIWSCGNGDTEGDVDAARRQVAAAIAEQVWDAMVPETGAPKPDDYDSGPAPTNRTDVYLVTPHLCKRRQGSCAPVPVDDGVPALAAVATAPPCGPGAGGALTTSGYMVLDRAGIPETLPVGPFRGRYTFAHEFFHLIENALNLEAQGGSCGAGAMDTITSWLVEASAEWAAWAYFPADGPLDRQVLFESFQKRPPGTTLRSLAGVHPYEAFIYPFFVQQERGGRTAFVDFWKNAGAARTAEQLDDRLDVTLPFAEHFRDFAVRNFNATAATLPGDPLPLAKRHQQQDPVLLADVRPYVLEPSVSLEAPTELMRAANVGPLSAQYDHYFVDAGTRWVRIDAQTLTNSAFVQLDALVNVDGTWTRRTIDGPVFEFCRDDPDDDISELYLIVSHRDRRPTATAGGTYGIRTKPVCPSGWSGTIRYLSDLEQHSYESGPSGIEIEDDRVREEHRWTVVSTLPAGDPPSLPYDTVELAWQGRYEKNRTWQRLNSGACLGQPIFNRTTAFGLGSGRDTTFMRSFAPTVYHPDISDEWVNNSIEGTFTHHDEICTGQTVDSSEPLEQVKDQLAAMVGVPALVEMVPNDPLDPNHYFGEHTFFDVTDPEPGGFNRITVTMTWDLRRR